jgi:hypothetical protein
VRDHYVEVTTTGGQHMLLMRLTDAIDELDDLPGERIHRSHWAAAAHLRRIARRGQKQVVLLSDGRDLARQQELRRRGRGAAGRRRLTLGATPYCCAARALISLWISMTSSGQVDLM